MAASAVFLFMYRARRRVGRCLPFPDPKFTRAVGTDARALMTADVEVSSTNDFTPADIEKIESVINASGIVEARNEAITTALMARPSDPANQTVDFVELKGIEPPFPLVGTVSRFLTERPSISRCFKIMVRSSLVFCSSN